MGMRRRIAQSRNRRLSVHSPRLHWQREEYLLFPPPPAEGECLLVSPLPPPSEGKEQELPLHPPRRTGPLSSEGIWDWLAEPEREIVEALPAGMNLLWARDGESWEAWEQQHHPPSLPDIAAMVLNYLAANMGGAPLPCPAPEGEEPSLFPTPEEEGPVLPSPAPKGGEGGREGTQTWSGRSPNVLRLSGRSPNVLRLSGRSPNVHSPREGVEHPQPRYLPAEGEFLLVPSLTPWEDCVSLPPPAAEGEFLLVPPQLPWEDCLPLPPPPAEGEYLLVPPLPPPPAEGEYLLVPPQLPWEDCLPLPPPPAESEYLLVPPPPPWEGLLLPCLASPKDACLVPPKDACLAPPKDACLVPPKDACLALPKDACLVPPKDACLALPKDACLAPPKDACLVPPKDACLALPKDACLAPPKDACLAVANLANLLLDLATF
ncbi:UNVERIFIED_CONTAM: hypothetical protein FKN15_020445 [Acipenser sinensis]